MQFDETACRFYVNYNKKYPYGVSSLLMLCQIIAGCVIQPTLVGAIAEVVSSCVRIFQGFLLLEKRSHFSYILTLCAIGMEQYFWGQF